MSERTATKEGHTPGPWAVNANKTGWTPQGWSIITRYEESPALSLDVAFVKKEADAPLIAAAPDLLDAARLALQRLERLGAEDYIENLGSDPASVSLRAAIAKAEGS